MKILVCDDELLMRDVVAVLLRLAKYQVEIAVDGQDALERIQANPNSFDVLITDHKMPRLSGIELINNLRGMNLRLKVIMISGYSDEMEMDAVARLQLDGFLKKPFKKIELLDCLKTLAH